MIFNLFIIEFMEAIMVAILIYNKRLFLLLSSNLRYSIDFNLIIYLALRSPLSMFQKNYYILSIIISIFLIPFI